MNKEIGEVSKEEIRVLKHTLGLDFQYVAYRNSYVLTTNCEDFEICEGLRKKDLMGREELTGSIRRKFVYYVTNIGKELMSTISKK